MEAARIPHSLNTLLSPKELLPLVGVIRRGPIRGRGGLVQEIDEVEEEMSPSDKANLMVPSPAAVRCTERTPAPSTTTSRAPPPSFLRTSHSSPAGPGSNA